MKRVTLYTDGACKGNPGPGGWGVLLQYGQAEKNLKGFVAETTNNRMELTAAIEGLRSLKEACAVQLFTDSRYVQQGIKDWLPNWKKKNWRTAAGKPVKNVDLWQALDDEQQRHEIVWHWVKGHAGDPGNEAADALANLAIEESR